MGDILGTQAKTLELVSVSMEVRPYRVDDFDRVAAIRMEAFRIPTEPSTLKDGGRVIVEGGGIQAILRFTRVGQFFGGQSVPCAVIGSVAVAPEARGRGLGSRLLAEVLREFHEDGLTLSTLYPSTLPVYRRAGYEQAGTRTRYRVPIRAVPSSRDSVVEPWDESSANDVQQCYRQFAAWNSGLLDRSPVWWERHLLTTLRGEAPYRYLFRSDGEVAGYLIYSQRQEAASTSGLPPGPAADYMFSMTCRDFVWNDARAARALLSFISSNRAIGSEVSWVGPPNEPLASFFEEEDIRISSSVLWMTRIVSVEKALEGRGYPPLVEASVELDVVDPILPSNRGPIRLDVVAGIGKVSAAERATLRLDVGTLAALYTGWMLARDAVLTGRLEGASEADINALEAVFAGPPPWNMDFF